ncbi:hypothetical protein TRSC58_06682 [Trypanosoma rangeli SC58]|uniref:Stress-response A/B barrel domain-containing protein n=1 Tax=Trypanosoma rangeli SC58 TaxID=429131 RepID=A0A061IUD9_TRYRA|nr:hypothetical protein TRSC58_06682 [Trypanosoma rangeli SC58]
MQQQNHLLHFALSTLTHLSPLLCFLFPPFVCLVSGWVCCRACVAFLVRVACDVVGDSWQLSFSSECYRLFIDQVINMPSNICHVVLFCLDAAKVATVLPDGVILHHLSVLREKVPGLLELNFGPVGQNLYPNYVDSSNGYTHCLVSKHLDPTHLKVYAEHPDHLTLVNLLKTTMTKPPLRVDFALGPQKQ